MSKILYFCHKISFHWEKNKKLIIVIAALIVVIAGVSIFSVQ